MIPLLTLVIGLLVGFYGRTVYNYVYETYQMLRERFDVHQGGVVRPERTKVTRNQPVNLESESGPIMKMTPDQITLERMKERNATIKRMHP